MFRAWHVVGVLPLPARASPWDPRLLWATLALAGVILIGAVVLLLLDRWRKNLNEPEACSANDQLSQFRVLYEQGRLSQEEFERIRNLLADRMRQQLEVPAAPPAPGPKPPEVPPPAAPPAPG
jgi:hypothetical protein